MDSQGKQTDVGHDAPPTEAELRLMAAVAEATRNGGSQVELEAAARGLVEQMRQQQVPPERVLIRMKHVLAEAGLRPAYSLAAETAEPLSIEATVYRNVIALSIRHYYGATS